MKILKIVFRRETLGIMLALIFASTVCFALVVGRVAVSKQIRYGFLLWNLVLAWMPLIFAMLARDFYRHSKRPDMRWWGVSAAWLLFFPNAPYIFTDAVHLTNRYLPHFWVDSVLLWSCALTGLVLGFVSLYLMQSLVTRMFGKAMSWLFVAVVAGLTSFGVYLGRFLRFNSWDIVLRPGKIYRGIDAWAEGPMINTMSIAFLMLFTVFIFITYVMLYALTHLPKLNHVALDEINTEVA